MGVCAWRSMRRRSGAGGRSWRRRGSGASVHRAGTCPTRWRVRSLCGAVVVTTATACGSGPVVVPVPAFDPMKPTPTSAPAEAAAGDDLPVDCGPLLGPDEVSALFGLPVDSVVVRTVLGAPSPSVGRLERLTCTYAVSGGTPQGVVLRMTVGAYRDATAAHDQHERNVADERAGASAPVQPELGSAAATVLQRDAGTILLTSSDVVTLDLDLPPRPAPLPPTDLLLDLARRVLARLAPQSSGAVSP